MKYVQLYENFLNKEETPFDKANKKAKKLFGEFGIATCKKEEVAKIIDLSKADKLAEKIFGEFGFITLDEDQMKEILNKNPSLVK